MAEYNHTFIISAYSSTEYTKIDGKLINEDNVIRYTKLQWLAFSEEIRTLIKQNDKIIYTGIFDMQVAIYFWPSYAFKKLYLHYWGGDFYCFKEPVHINNVIEYIKRYMTKKVFRKANAVIFLIDGEYDKYRKITKITQDKVYVAPMPGDPLDEFDFANHRNEGVYSPLRITIGNSSTITNNHMEIFEKLEHLKDENIEIYCPLVYGNESEREKVLKEGKKIFGHKFHALTEWQQLHDFYSLLATCPVGIYNNNRQQGMGNISAMLYLGKKVYLRSDTSMYENYSKQGFYIHDVNELDDISIEDLIKFDEKNHNIEIADSLNDMDDAVAKWRNVFES
jgi:hypothetical protein